MPAITSTALAPPTPQAIMARPLALGVWESVPIIDDDTRVVPVDAIAEPDILSDDIGGDLGLSGGRGGGGDGECVDCAEGRRDFDGEGGHMGRALTEIGVCVFFCCR